MANTYNTGVYPQEWALKLQQRLKHPTTWRAVSRVEITNVNTFNNPYMSTTPSIQSGTRGTAVTIQDYALTNESVTIDTRSELGVYIDVADEAQCGLLTQMELADRQGQLMNEKIESVALAQHTAWTDFGGADIGLGGASTDQITVSASNIDDIIRGIKKKIRVANGQSLMSQNGVFIVWRPGDFEILEAFVQANGFSSADMALRNGTEVGMSYMGVEHYVSNDHTANHLFAGVKNLFHIGILRKTWGQLRVVESPAGASGGVLTGTALIVQADYKTKVWNFASTLLYDVNVV